MEFFTAGVGVLKTLVTAIGAGLGACRNYSINDKKWNKIQLIYIIRK